MSNMFKVNNKDNRTTLLVSFLLLTLNIFHTFYSVSVGNFELVVFIWATFPSHVPTHFIQRGPFHTPIKYQKARAAFHQFKTFFAMFSLKLSKIAEQQDSPFKILSLVFPENNLKCKFKWLTMNKKV